MLKNQKGITLVALVITIVILIILATVSITIALNGGLVGHAESGADAYKAAAGKEDKDITNVQHWVNDLLVRNPLPDGE